MIYLWPLNQMQDVSNAYFYAIEVVDWTSEKKVLIQPWSLSMLIPIDGKFGNVETGKQLLHDFGLWTFSMKERESPGRLLERLLMNRE